MNNWSLVEGIKGRYACGNCGAHTLTKGSPPLRACSTCCYELTPDRHVVVSTNENGEAIAVTWQDDEHRILDVIWEKKSASALLEPVTMDWTTTIRDYVANTVPDDEITCQWTKGYEECKRRINKMYMQPVNAKFLAINRNQSLVTTSKL